MASYRQSFDVIGKGQFPFDMLRYDCCYPANGSDVYVMRDDRNTSERVVMLTRTVESKKARPTVERWKSFGWIVRDVYTR